MRADTHIQRRHTHTHSAAESTPALHMNDITVKFSGEVWVFVEDGGLVVVVVVERSAVKGKTLVKSLPASVTRPSQTT